MLAPLHQQATVMSVSHITRLQYDNSAFAAGVFRFGTQPHRSEWQLCE